MSRDLEAVRVDCEKCATTPATVNKMLIYMCKCKCLVFKKFNFINIIKFTELFAFNNDFTQARWYYKILLFKIFLY